MTGVETMNAKNAKLDVINLMEMELFEELINNDSGLIVLRVPSGWVISQEWGEGSTWHRTATFGPEPEPQRIMRLNS